MKKILLVIFLLPIMAVAASTGSIKVDRCEIDNVAIMQTPAEFERGMLGYTDSTFTFEAMLFSMNQNGRKVFHTIGMKMNIVIVGVSKLDDDTYITLGNVYVTPPGINAVQLFGTDVLEIPEFKYRMKYKRCLDAKESRM